MRLVKPTITVVIAAGAVLALSGCMTTIAPQTTHTAHVSPSRTTVQAPTPSLEPATQPAVDNTTTVHYQFTDGTLIAKAGNLTKDCGAMPMPFEGATNSGYSVISSNGQPIEIRCEVEAPLDVIQEQMNLHKP